MYWTLRRITELWWQNLSGTGRKAHTKTKAFRKAYRSSERPEVESMFNGQQKSHQKAEKLSGRPQLASMFSGQKNKGHHKDPKAVRHGLS